MLRRRVLFGLSLLMIFSGAFNYGFSRYVMAVPFMLLAVYLAYKHFSKTVLIATLCYCAAAVAINQGLERNPFVFPILVDGTATVQRDGFYKQYNLDGSGSFSETDYEEFRCTGCGEVRYVSLKKGQVLKITGVSIGHPDFGMDVGIITDVGRFPDRDYGAWSLEAIPEAPLQLNKPVESPLFAKLGVLMYFPIFLLAPLAFR